MKDRDVILILLLLWFLTRKKESTSVSFPGTEVLQECPGGWTVPYGTPCPPTT